MALDPSWKTDIERELRSDEIICLKHIKNNTFEERAFTDYFLHWDQYFYIISRFEGVRDTYDASTLPMIAKYYNNHTYTNNRYDEGTGAKKR